MTAFSPARPLGTAVGLVILLGAGACSDDDDSGPERSRSAEEARKCLVDDGFRASGGGIDTSDDANAPDGVVYTYSSGAHAQIAFYDDLARARKHEPEIHENAKRFDGEVVRIDRATIVWLRKPALGARMRVERCVTAP